MPAKQVGAVYLVDCECFNTAVLRKYGDTLQNNYKKSKVVKVKVLVLVSSSRTYTDLFGRHLERARYHADFTRLIPSRFLMLLQH
jgi:hypothetical protein